MEAKNVLYAAVGAPVVMARKVGDRVGDWRDQLSKESYSKSLEKKIDEWAAEGKKVVDRLGDADVVEEISARVDLDQAKEQVGKLRDQLEDMLDTWRASFRPERAEMAPATKQPAAPPAEASAPKAPAKKSASKSGGAKKTATKKPAAKTGAAANTDTAKSA